MPVVAVVGGQWGDEGKGKVIDMLAGEAEVVIRATGGDNAGHTVINPQGEFALHLVPAGVFNPEATCIIAPGVLLNPAVLIQELDALEKRGVATRGLLISDRTHMVMPYHLTKDRLQDAQRGDPIGTTGRGIGPAYEDKVARVGVRVGDLRQPEVLRKRVRAAVEKSNQTLSALGATELTDPNAVVDEYLGYADRLGPFISDVSAVVAGALDRDAKILLEGAQATLLDIDHGTYPYATSSACTVAGLCQGSGIPPRAITHSIGVYKAYSTRVGTGPMPTELDDETGDYLPERAHEFGTTTGRARRCGWFDGVVSRYTARINGFDSIALTRLDIHDEMDSINVCVAYELDGKRVEHPPSDPAVFGSCRPVYETLPGWKTSICNIADFEELPPEAAQFVGRIEDIVGVPANVIGVGPARAQSVGRGDFWRF